MSLFISTSSVVCVLLLCALRKEMGAGHHCLGVPADSGEARLTVDWAEFRKGYSYAVGLESILACTCAATLFAMTAGVPLPASVPFACYSVLGRAPCFCFATCVCPSMVLWHSYVAVQMMLLPC